MCAFLNPGRNFNQIYENWKNPDLDRHQFFVVAFFFILVFLNYIFLQKYGPPANFAHNQRVDHGEQAQRNDEYAQHIGYHIMVGEPVRARRVGQGGQCRSEVWAVAGGIRSPLI